MLPVGVSILVPLGVVADDLRFLPVGVLLLAPVGVIVDALDILPAGVLATDWIGVAVADLASPLSLQSPNSILLAEFDSITPEERTHKVAPHPWSGAQTLPKGHLQ